MYPRNGGWQVISALLRYEGPTILDIRSLTREARVYDVGIVLDCVATFDPEAHALQHMEKILGATVAKEAMAPRG